MALPIDYAFPLALERRESSVNASSAPRNCLRSELDYGEFFFRKVLGISLTIFTILIVKVRYLTKKIEKEG